MKLPEPFNAEVGAALLDFNGEAVPYCQGISDADAHEYAMDYARMLRSRAKGRACVREDSLFNAFVRAEPKVD